MNQNGDHDGLPPAIPSKMSIGVVRASLFTLFASHRKESLEKESKQDRGERAYIQLQLVKLMPILVSEPQTQS